MILYINIAVLTGYSHVGLDKLCFFFLPIILFFLVYSPKFYPLFFSKDLLFFLSRLLFSIFEDRNNQVYPNLGYMIHNLMSSM